ncbi:MAG: hypothetical protein NWR73_09065 [Flavobacteriales bacterium]|nr:hypothetical protein [Flavobacteriales bacterium]
MPKTMLIACFDFPPNEGIGGRRWAKLAKGLAGAGWQVHVIKANPAGNSQTSGWDDDANSDGIIVHSLPRTYPESVSHPKGSVIDKIRYRLAIRKLKKIEQGTIYDIAIGWKDAFQKKAIELIEQHQITAVAATGAPFNLLYYATQLKETFPNLKVLCDYRDPWLTAQNYGMKGLEKSRMDAETKKQEYIFKNADWVTCPNDFLLQEIKDTAIEKPRAQFRSLTHFYDPDDLVNYLNGTETKGEKIRIIYGGAIYMGIEGTLKSLNSGLNHLKVSNQELYHRLEIRFYTPHVQHAHIFAEHPCVAFSPTIGKKFFTELRQSHAAMIFLADHNKNYLTTKFFEYLPFKVPLLYFGENGFVAKFIAENNLGIYVQHPSAELPPALEKVSTSNSNFNQNFEASQFSLEQKAHELIKLFE